MIKFNKYFVPYIIILFLVGFRGKLVIAFLFVILHEFSHYLTARKLGFSGLHIEILPFGAALKLKNLDDASIEEDLVISIAGPSINFILAVIFYLLLKNSYTSELNILFMTNLSLGMFNLIPAFPLDGGRILRDILSKKFTYRKASQITVFVSIISGMIILIVYFILFCYGINNLNLILISFFILSCSFKEKERIVYIIMNDIIKKKFRFIKKGYIENRCISIFYKKDLLYALSIIDKNKYSIITVLDNDMKVIAVIYEEEVIEAIKDFGNITFEEFIKNKKK